MGFADTLMVGRYSTTALASAAFVNNVFNLVIFLLIGYSYGLTPIISSLYGKGEHANAGGKLKQAIAANALFGLMLMAIMGVLYFYVDRMGQPEELLPTIRPYYLVVLSSMVFIMLVNTLRQFTDGTTDTATGMWALLAGNALNIVGNYLLIYGIGPFPELGLLGAGLSTLFARFVTAAILACNVVWRKRYLPFRQGFGRASLRLREILAINKISLPISLQMGMEAGAFSLSAVMAGWLGKIDLAAYQVVVTVGTLGFMFYYSFGAGMSIRVGTFTGMDDWPRLRLATRAGCHILCVIAALSSLTFIFLTEPLVNIFSTDPAVIGVAVSLIGPLVLYQFGDAMQICFANALRGTGQVMSMMWIAFVSYVVVGLPSGYILGFPLGLGIHGIFLAFAIGLFVAATLFYINYRKVLNRHLAPRN